MKSLLLTLPIVITSVIASGQDKPADIKTGRIYFEEKIKLEIKLEGDAAQYSEMFPKERKSEKILSFTPDATIFEAGKDIAGDMDQTQGEGVKIRMVVSGDNSLFTDLKNSKIIEQRDFMNRMFLIEKDLPPANWKITGNQKIILNYVCMEATRLDTAGKKTIVWFAPSLSIKGGPAGFCNLPGMVLEVDVNNGTRSYLAKSVEAVAANDLKIKKPSDGKKVTENEFKEIMAEKMKEMGVDEGGAGDGSHVKIVIKH